MDQDGDSLEIRVIITEPEHGTATIADGEVVYVPEPDFNGEDSFTYEVCDPDLLCDTAVVVVTVTPVNDAPVARDDAVETTEGTSVTIDVLANDEDVDGDPLTVTSVDDVVGGTVVIEDGLVVFLPTPGFSGEASFTYTVRDPDGETATATVTVTVVADSPDEGPEVGPEVSPEETPEGPVETAEPGPEPTVEESPELVEANPEEDDSLREGLVATGGGGCAGGGAGVWWFFGAALIALVRPRSRL